MADIRAEILEYADRLYAKALESMDEQQFRMADIYATCSYGASVFILSDRSAPKSIRDHAQQLDEAALKLSQYAHSAEWSAMLKPSMQGPLDDDRELQEARRGLAQTARDVFKGRR